MCAKKYISDNCYIDTNLHCFVRRDDKRSFSVPDKPWRYVEYLMKYANNRDVSREEVARYVQQSDTLGYNDVENLRSTKRNLKTQYTKILNLDDKEFDAIFYSKNGRLRFCPQVESREIEISQAAFQYIADTKMRTEDLTEMIDCMLFQGISGKMGRHTLLSLAKANNAFAMFELGELYYYGFIKHNRVPDLEKACEWYEKASALNHPGACWSLAYLIVKNTYPHVPEGKIDYAKALSLLKRALNADSDSARACAAALTTIGELWETGKYPAPDFSIEQPHFEKADVKKAHLLYKEASDKGYHYATNRLAAFHERNGFLQDAFELYRQSAQMTADGYTYNKLGLMLENGLGCDRDPAEACKCYIAAVEDVLPDDVTPWGMFNAARVYATLVPGQPKHYLNLKRAFDLFFSAMEALPVEKHDQMLNAMLDVIIFNTNAFHTLGEEAEYIKEKVVLLTRRYLEAVGENAQIRSKLGMLSDRFA